MTDHILVDDRDGIRSVTINRPDKKNALTGAMYAAMADALDGAEGSPDVRVVVFRGTGGAFTAGNDLKDFLHNPPGGANSPVSRFLKAIATATVPVVAAVDGPAVGVGTTMLLHCDFVLAGENARFQMPFINLALVPEAGSSLTLQRLAGYQKAAELLMLGEPFDAGTAVDIGLALRQVPSGDLDASAAALAKTLASKPPQTMRTVKGLMKRGEEPVMDRIAAEGAAFNKCLASAEAREAMTAFFEKRAPDWSKAG